MSDRGEECELERAASLQVDAINLSDRVQIDSKWYLIKLFGRCNDLFFFSVLAQIELLLTGSSSRLSYSFYLFWFLQWVFYTFDRLLSHQWSSILPNSSLDDLMRNDCDRKGALSDICLSCFSLSFSNNSVWNEISNQLTKMIDRSIILPESITNSTSHWLNRSDVIVKIKKKRETLTEHLERADVFCCPLSNHSNFFAS